MPGLRNTQRRRDALLDDRMRGSGDDIDTWLSDQASRGDFAPNAPVAPIEAADDSDTDAWIGSLARDFGSQSQPQEPDESVKTPSRSSGDNGYADALRRSEDAGSYNVLDFLAAALNPGDVNNAIARKKAAAEAPIKQWQEGQRLAQEADRNAANQEYRDALIADRERGRDQRDVGLGQGQQRADATTRNTNIRQRQADPRSDWNQQRRGETMEDWQTRLAYSGAEHDRRFDREAAERLKRSRAEGGMSPEPYAGGGPPSTQQEGIADALRVRAEGTEGFVPNARWNYIIDQLARSDEGGGDNPRRTQLINAAEAVLDQHEAQHAKAAEGIEQARRQENIPQTIADIDQALSTVERHRDPSTGDVPGMSRFDRAAPNIPIVGGMVDSANRLVEGESGQDVRSAVNNVKEAMLRYRTGMAATGKETSRIDAILGMNWEADPEAFLRAVKQFRARLENMDASIVQGHGVAGGETFARRRQGATQVAPQMQRPVRVAPNDPGLVFE